MNAKLNKPRDSFIYGRHAVEAVLSFAPFRARKLILARKKDAEKLEDLARLANISCEYMDRSRLEKRYDIGSDAQGIILHVSSFPYVPLEELLDREPFKLLLLDTWQDAANIGRAARAALCFGASGLVICADRSAEINAVAEKSAVGALARIPVARVKNLAMAMKKIKEEGFFIYGADEYGFSSLNATDFASKVAVVIGQEGAGLRELTKKNCDMLVKVPMQGSDICLNAADTALLFLYELNKK